MWEISNISQVNAFLYSIISGAFFALFYDLFRSFRNVKKHTNLLVFVEDIFYFSVIAVITFILFLCLTAGEIRGYILIGISTGFLLFFMFFSKYSLIVFTAVFKLIKMLLLYFKKIFYATFDKIDVFMSDFLKNTLKCFKKDLKTLKVLLYTNKK